jgi:glucose-6-phosphate 1-epimerase
MSAEKFVACKGNGDLSMIKIRTTKGATASIYLYGATVTSYTDIDGKERLFTSKQAVFNGKKAIRGGIPLVFPQFGPSTSSSTHKLPNHGFARISEWTFDGVTDTSSSATTTTTTATTTTTSDDDQTTAVFSLLPTPYIQSLWNYDFKLVYTITISSYSLTTRLTVHNTGDKVFDFQALLHTYYAIDSIHNIQVSGLKGVDYVDKLRDASIFNESKDNIMIDKEVDSVYTNAPIHCTIEHKETASIVVNITRSTTSTSNSSSSSSSSDDFVVWNPWINKSKGMSDFGDEEYLTMLCVEPGSVNDWKKLEIGKQFFLEQKLEFK